MQTLINAICLTAVGILFAKWMFRRIFYWRR